MKKALINLLLIFVEAIAFGWVYMNLVVTKNIGGCVWDDCPNPYDAASLGLLIILLVFGLIVYAQTKFLDRRVK